MNPHKEVILSLSAPFRDKIDIHRLRFGEPATGPHIGIVAGLHGNEIGGVCAVNQLVSKLRQGTLVGCVDVYPCVNRMGLDESSKVNPLDHRDINRWFPGHPEGSASERIAYAVFEALEPCDWVLSVHTGAEHISDMVQARCLKEDTDSVQRSGAPLVWKRNDLDGRVSLLGQCQARGQSVLYLTGGSGHRLDADIVQSMQEVIWRWLNALGSVQDVVSPKKPDIVFEGNMTEIRSQCGGLFVPMVKPNQVVRRGMALGRIQDVVGGDLLETFEAPCEARITSVRQNPIVYPQELVLRLIPDIQITH